MTTGRYKNNPVATSRRTRFDQITRPKSHK